jgi:ornithine carbamoyltransferase
MKKFKSKHLLSLSDLTVPEILDLFELARKLKSYNKKSKAFRPLKGRVLAMIFKKSSTRTRLSFESGIYQLGGHGIFLNSQDLQLGRGESIGDTARVLSRFCDGIMIRTFDQKEIEELALHSQVPVINGLTDFVHPCQILADLFTIMERKPLGPELRICYIGDGNNIANTWLSAAQILNFKMDFILPSGYGLKDAIFQHCGIDRKNLPGNITFHEKPDPEIVKNADVIYTDVWVSMGEESEREQKVQALRPYQLNSALIAKAKKDIMIMHCLPAHRGEEITDDVMESPNSVVFDQAENRLHVQKALMCRLMR